MSQPDLSTRIDRARRRLFHRAAVHGRIVVLLLAAVLVSFWLVGTDAAAERLFQSPPQSPPAEQPPAEQPPPESQPPAEQPPAESQPPAEQPQTQPPAEQPPAVSPVSPPAGESGPPPLSPEPPAGPAEAAPVERQPEPLPPPPPDENISSARQFILDQAELIDAIVVSGAYLWLCCGILLLLAVPVVMLIIYIRGRSRLHHSDM